MGLGKTLLMIGIMYVNFMPQTLIILPPNLIQQWEQQIYKICGHKPLVYYGLNKKNAYSNLHKAPIVLTSYYTLFSQNGRPSHLFDIKWSKIIFDEGHHMRNKKTRIFRYARDFNNTSPQAIKYILTGTPIQNNNKDLKNLIQILGLDIDKKHPIYLEKFIKKYVLLRTKKEVGIQMPPLSIKDIIVDWQKEKEQQLGDKLHKPLKKILVIQDNDDNDEQEHDLEINDIDFDLQDDDIGRKHNDTTNPLVDLLRARQVCILPKLLKQTFNSLCHFTPQTLTHHLSHQTPLSPQTSLDYTSKIDALIQKIIENKDNNNGKIIFCHFQKEIDTIMLKLQKEGIHNIKKYDGRNSKQSLHNIAEKCDVLILQIQTCCEGLNLQEHFNECYFVSPHWNPSVEQQAIARCHQFGQKKGVKVFNFIMNDFKDKITIEKYIKKVQHKKLQLMNDFTKICKNKKKIIKKLVIQN